MKKCRTCKFMKWCNDKDSKNIKDSDTYLPGYGPYCDTFEADRALWHKVHDDGLTPEGEYPYEEAWPAVDIDLVHNCNRWEQREYNFVEELLITLFFHGTDKIVNFDEDPLPNFAEEALADMKAEIERERNLIRRGCLYGKNETKCQKRGTR